MVYCESVCGTFGVATTGLQAAYTGQKKGSDSIMRH